jgi:hypothetical protein
LLACVVGDCEGAGFADECGECGGDFLDVGAHVGGGDTGTVEAAFVAGVGAGPTA